MTISAEHMSKFTALHRQWWRLHMSEKFSSGTINSIQPTNQPTSGPLRRGDLYLTMTNVLWWRHKHRATGMKKIKLYDTLIKKMKKYIFKQKMMIIILNTKHILQCLESFILVKTEFTVVETSWGIEITWNNILVTKGRDATESAWER